jgi:D-amino-acid dehydrogenase
MSTQSVIVIGAGIIGVNIALRLQRSGHHVTLMDRASPGTATSSGNAGIFAGYGVTPLSMPGIAAKVPGMLLDPHGPLSIRRSHLLPMIPWLWKFWRASRPETVQHVSAALKPLVRTSLSAYQAISRGTKAERYVHASPVLCVYANRAAYQADRAAWDLRRQHGVQWSLLEGQQVQDMEPALSEQFGFAAAIEGCGFTTDPKALTRALFDVFIEAGGTFVESEVQHLNHSAARPAVMVNGTQHSADHVVVACGAWSGQFASQLHEAVPLQQERGYHITLGNYEGTTPKLPVMSPGFKVISTPMEPGLRIAGMVEFGGFLPPDHTRSASLRRHLQQLYPGIRGGEASSWMGHRPTLPDSLPVISESTRNPKILYAFGHHHLGLTTAPATAQAIAAMIDGSPLPFDIAGYSIRRFL